MAHIAETTRAASTELLVDSDLIGSRGVVLSVIRLVVVVPKRCGPLL